MARVVSYSMVTTPHPFPIKWFTCTSVGAMPMYRSNTDWGRAVMPGLDGVNWHAQSGTTTSEPTYFMCPTSSKVQRMMLLDLNVDCFRMICKCILVDCSLHCSLASIHEISKLFLCFRCKAWAPFTNYLLHKRCLPVQTFVSCFIQRLLCPMFCSVRCLDCSNPGNDSCRAAPKTVAGCSCKPPSGPKSADEHSSQPCIAQHAAAALSHGSAFEHFKASVGRATQLAFHGRNMRMLNRSIWLHECLFLRSISHDCANRQSIVVIGAAESILRSGKQGQAEIINFEIQKIH